MRKNIFILILALLFGANVNAQTCFNYTALPSESEITCSVDSVSYTVTALPDLVGCNYTFTDADLNTSVSETPFTGTLGNLCICVDDICIGTDSIKVTQTIYYEASAVIACDTILVTP